MDNALYHLLFVDDDQDFLSSMNMAISAKRLVEQNSVEVERHFVSNPHEGIAFARELTMDKEKLAVIVTDQQMPGLTGIDFIERVNAITPKSIKVLLTGYATLSSAKYAINQQILDQYISKPIEDYDNFACIIKNAIKTYIYREEKEGADRQIRHYVKELESRNAKIKRMHRAAERIAYLSQGFRKLDLDDVFDLIITKLPLIFKAKYASLFLLNEERNVLEQVRSNYLIDTFTKPLNSPDPTPMMVALEHNRIIVQKNVADSCYDLLDKPCLGDACIIIPFVVDGHIGSDILGNTAEVKGVLNMAGIHNMESEQVVNYSATLIQNILGINILNARLYQKTQQLALIDGLTGLYNKCVFMEFLKKERDCSDRRGTPFYLAIIDVDDFKAINDTHGHRIGDEVLAQLGRLFKEAARRSDIIARCGGEEFGWIMHGAESSVILATLQRLLEKVRRCEFPASVKLSISAGLTRYDPGCNPCLTTLYDRADDALYSAKKRGKNRIEINIEEENDA